MKWLFVPVWILVQAPVLVLAQADTQHVDLKFSYDHGPLSYSYEVHTVLFECADGEPLYCSLNDSLQKLVQSYFREFIPSHYNKTEDESDYHGAIEELEITHEVIQNSDSVLSVTILVHSMSGRYGSLNKYCYNLDLINSQFIELSELFNEADMPAVERLIENAYDSLQSGSFNEYRAYINLHGINLTQGSLLVHYSVYNGQSVYLPITVEVPWHELKPYLRKEMLWLTN